MILITTQPQRVGQIINYTYMQPSEENEQDDNNGTAPDSDTQSSAASSYGGRTTEEGSEAPEMPAEGE